MAERDLMEALGELCACRGSRNPYFGALRCDQDGFLRCDACRKLRALNCMRCKKPIPCARQKDARRTCGEACGRKVKSSDLALARSLKEQELHANLTRREERKRGKLRLARKLHRALMRMEWFNATWG